MRNYIKIILHFRLLLQEKDFHIRTVLLMRSPGIATFYLVALQIFLAHIGDSSQSSVVNKAIGGIYLLVKQ